MITSSNLLLNLLAVSVGSALGALVLKPMAKRIGGIPHASFANSFAVCFLSTSLLFGIWYVLGEDAFRIGIGGILFLNLALLAGIYIPAGKLIWRTTWAASLKANAVWLLIASVLSGFVMYKMAELM